MEPLPIFVYGTLKTGEVRAGQWPYPPLRIVPGIARGALYDLGPYPAITTGDDAILGELWHVDPEHLPETLARLDHIECFGVGGVDLYVRQVIPVRLLDGTTQAAYAYFFADPDKLQRFRRVTANGQGLCSWSAAAANPKPGE